MSASLRATSGSEAIQRCRLTWKKGKDWIATAFGLAMTETYDLVTHKLPSYTQQHHAGSLQNQH
jgi:hypothetical protein